MKDNLATAAESTTPMKSLSPDALLYLESVDPEMVTGILDTFAQNAEVESLRNACAAGLASPKNFDVAAARASAVLNLVATGEFPVADKLPIEQRIEVASEWIESALAVHGKELSAAISEKIDTLSPKSRIPRFKLLTQQRFVQSQHDMRLAHSNRWRHGGDGSKVNITAVGEQISRGYVAVALAMCGPSMDRFPITLALHDENDVRTDELNLLDQYVLEAQMSPAPWGEISALLKPGSDAWYEMGAAALALANAMGAKDPIRGAYPAMVQFYLNKPSVPLLAMLHLLGSGAQFRDPESSWPTLIAARCPVAVVDGGEAREGIPPWAAFGHVDTNRGGGDLTLASLRRFFVEGGLSPDAQYEGKTILQIAAAAGLLPEIQVLLDVGADPALRGDAEARPPGTLARDNGHDQAAVLLQTAAARSVMRRAARGSAT